MADSFITPLVENLKNKTADLMKSNISVEEFEAQNKKNHEEFEQKMELLMKMGELMVQAQMSSMMNNHSRHLDTKREESSPFYKKHTPTREIIVVPLEEQCNIPGCERAKLKDNKSGMCKFHKCDKCDKRTHAKHGIFCRDCDK
jgi:hypothetical protein